MVYIGIVLMIFVSELFIKNKIDQNMKPGEKQEIANGRVIIHKYKNKGAFLNFMHTKEKLVVAVSVIFTMILCVYFILSLGRRGNFFLRTGLAFLLGGAFSNTYDRLKRKYVVDYFSFHTKSKKLNAIVFNLSDFCIVIGAMLTTIAS